MSNIIGLYILLLTAFCGLGLGFNLVLTDVQSSFSRPDPIAPKYIVALSKGHASSPGSLMTVSPGVRLGDDDDDDDPSSDPAGALPAAASAASATAAAAGRLPSGCPRVPMTAENGRKYCCTVPTPECMAESNMLRQQAQELLNAQALPTGKTPFELLDAMSAMCMYRQDGLWTYEVCYKKHARQFRLDNSGRNEDFSCGAYTGDEKQDGSIKEDTSSHPHPIRYVAHSFAGGAECAMTGEPRTAEVRFTCLADVTDNSIVTIKEFPTCNYVFLVNALPLCKHPQFQPPPEQESTILCELATSDSCDRQQQQQQQQQQEEEEEEEEEAAAAASSDSTPRYTTKEL